MYIKLYKLRESVNKLQAQHNINIWSSIKNVFIFSLNLHFDFFKLHKKACMIRFWYQKAVLINVLHGEVLLIT